MFTPVLERLAVELSIPVAIGFRAPDFQHVSSTLYPNAAPLLQLEMKIVHAKK